MTRADLVEEVSRVIEMPRKDAEIIVVEMLHSMIRSLHAGDKVEIRGFGSFTTRERPGRTGRNPRTGVRVDIPAKRVPYFKPGKELKALVNQG